MFKKGMRVRWSDAVIEAYPEEFHRKIRHERGTIISFDDATRKPRILWDGEGEPDEYSYVEFKPY
jgi:hypothetical protein